MWCEVNSCERVHDCVQEVLAEYECVVRTQHLLLITEPYGKVSPRRSIMRFTVIGANLLPLSVVTPLEFKHLAIAANVG
ncbi:hypothetical protein D3C75_1181800 [compost metagenome]